MIARKVVKKQLLIFSLIFFSIALHSCSKFFLNTGVLPIDYSGDFLALSWEDEIVLEEYRSTVDYYNIYYRPLGTLQWSLLGEAAAGSGSFCISKLELGYGKFEFAVEAVYLNGRCSELHASTDFSAWPPGGWYVNWFE